MAHVLVVDDEPLIRKSITRTLMSHFDTVEAADGSSAALLLGGQVFDVVISDRDMPNRNGVWLLEQVRDKQPGALRVLMSGHDPVDLAAYLSSGLVQKWLPKPFSSAELLVCLGIKPAST